MEPSAPGFKSSYKSIQSNKFWNAAYGSGERGGITISRRPNKCPSIENAPGPNKAIPMAVMTISRVTSVTPSEASGGPGIRAKAIQRTQRPAIKLASGVKKPRIKPAPLSRNRPETTHTSGVRSANLTNSRAPSDTAMPPRAVRKRSSATPGLPLGKVENNRCSGASVRAHKQSHDTRKYLGNSGGATLQGGSSGYLFRGTGRKRLLELNNPAAQANRDRLGAVAGT